METGNQDTIKALRMIEVHDIVFFAFTITIYHLEWFLTFYLQFKMIFKLLRLPGSYWLYRERMIYRQTGDSHMVEIPNF